MSIYEIYPFDLATAPPQRVFALSQLLTKLPTITRGAPTAKLLMVADNIPAEEVKAGFAGLAVPDDTLPAGMRNYKTIYEEFLDQVAANEVRYMRLYLALASTRSDAGILDMLASVGLSASVLDHAIPRPFATAAGGQWDKLSEGGMRWALLRTTNQQGGSVTPWTLHGLFALPFPIWSGLHMHTFPPSAAAQALGHKDAMVQYATRDSRAQSEEADRAGRGTSRLREEIAQGAFAHTWQFYVLVGAPTEVELEDRLLAVRGVLPFEMMKVTPPGPIVEKLFSAEQLVVDGKDGVLTGTPGLAILAGSALSYRRRTRTEGIIIGVDSNQAPVTIYQFANDDNHPSYNEVVTGETGSGKTFQAVLKALRLSLLGVGTVFVDPTGNVDLTWLNQPDEQPVVHWARLGRDGHRLNPMERVYDELALQADLAAANLRMLSVDVEGPTATPVLDEALMALYEPRMGREDLEEPLLEDLERALREIARRAVTTKTREAAEDMAYQLYPYIHGTRRALFGPSSVDTSLNHPITVYDVSALPKTGRGRGLRAASLAILMFRLRRTIVRRRALGDMAPIWWNTDEWSVVNDDPTYADHVTELFKTARSLGLAMSIMDQDLPSLLGPLDVRHRSFGEVILTNARYRFLFRQSGNARDRIAQVFPEIPEALRESIVDFGLGECVAMLPGDLIRMRVLPGELERVVLSSRLADRPRVRALMDRLLEGPADDPAPAEIASGLTPVVAPAEKEVSHVVV